MDIVWHNNGQSNGNPGFCEKDPSTMLCVNPPSKNVYLPGQVGVDMYASHAGPITPRCIGSTDKNCAAKPMPLSMLQPY